MSEKETQQPLKPQERRRAKISIAQALNDLARESPPPRSKIVRNFDVLAGLCGSVEEAMRLVDGRVIDIVKRKRQVSRSEQAWRPDVTHRDVEPQMRHRNRRTGKSRRR